MRQGLGIVQNLFSAHAEVFPHQSAAAKSPHTLLRARGGISEQFEEEYDHYVSSPRTRRYFQPMDDVLSGQCLFSAHAEVFPCRGGGGRWRGSLLRARGGISGNPLLIRDAAASSPRTRRYFRGQHEGHRASALFSAHAEVFPFLSISRARRPSLLRARGGISAIPGDLAELEVSSPRTRRYFPPEGESHDHPRLFSAHAEVFPALDGYSFAAGPLLRARGGISLGVSMAMARANSSPRTRRYFRVPPRAMASACLFSAHAEVFPTNSP